MKRKYGVVLAILATVMFWAFSAQAYTINDAVPDSIGYPTFETYGMNMINFTPGTNSGVIKFQIFTNFPATGDTVNGTPPWTTTLADLFIMESYSGPANGNVRQDYTWAIPLVNHDGFTAGTLYAVGSALTSTDVYNTNGGGNYIYNPNVNVLINTVGSNYGQTSIGGGSVAAIGPNATMPYWEYDITTGFYEDDAFATMKFLWGTATCANDILTGQVPAVPIPPTAILLGSGLLGLVGLRKWRHQSDA